MRSSSPTRKQGSEYCLAWVADLGGVAFGGGEQMPAIGGFPELPGGERPRDEFAFLIGEPDARVPGNRQAVVVVRLEVRTGSAMFRTSLVVKYYFVMQS